MKYLITSIIALVLGATAVYAYQAYFTVSITRPTTDEEIRIYPVSMGEGLNSDTCYVGVTASNTLLSCTK